MNKGDNRTFADPVSRDKTDPKTHRYALLVLHSVARRRQRSGEPYATSHPALPHLAGRFTVATEPVLAKLIPTLLRSNSMLRRSMEGCGTHRTETGVGNSEVRSHAE